MKQRIISVILIISTLFPTGRFAAAQTAQTPDTNFDPNLILTDNDVYDVSGMSYSQITSFLKTKGTLADYRTTDIDGVPKTAPEIIWRVSNSYKINPKYMLALLQKEQSLVEDRSPVQGQYDWATGFGVCDDCSKDDPSISDFKGFANQLEYAAKQMREKYFLRILTNGQTKSGYAPGRMTLIDGLEVTPVNVATAALYTYTPHIHGNENLWNIWRRWFSKNYPDGTVVRGVPSGSIWWIRLGERRPFASASVATTLVDLSKVVEASDSELSAYQDGPAISFPNYALLRDPQGKIWLLSGNERRHIINMETFRTYGFNEDEVENATNEDLAPYEIGLKITLASKYPQGALLQDGKSKEVWYAESGVRHLISQPSLLTMYFKNRKPKITTTLALGELTLGEPYLLKDGELVKAKGSSAVYVMENGKRRPITSADVFLSLGWKWKNIVTLPANYVESYPVGDPVVPNISSVQLASASNE
jgi:hypothetical protein